MLVATPVTTSNSQVIKFNIQCHLLIQIQTKSHLLRSSAPRIRDYQLTASTEQVTWPTHSARVKIQELQQLIPRLDLSAHFPMQTMNYVIKNPNYMVGWTETYLVWEQETISFVEINHSSHTFIPNGRCDHVIAWLILASQWNNRLHASINSAPNLVE